VSWFADWLYELAAAILLPLLIYLAAVASPVTWPVSVALVAVLAIREAGRLIPERPDPTEEALAALQADIDVLKTEQTRLNTMAGLRPKRTE
jgi:hypothetical protein